MTRPVAGRSYIALVIGRQSPRIAPLQAEELDTVARNRNYRDVL